MFTLDRIVLVNIVTVVCDKIVINISWNKLVINNKIVFPQRECFFSLVILLKNLSFRRPINATLTLLNTLLIIRHWEICRMNVIEIPLGS